MKHANSVFTHLRFFTFQKHTCFHSHLILLAMLSCINLSSIRSTPDLCLNDSALTRKKMCFIFLLLPENIMGVPILNIILKMSRSCLPAGIIFSCVYFASWYLIKISTWVEGCWLKTGLRSTKINCCMFVLLVALEASYFL